MLDIPDDLQRTDVDITQLREFIPSAVVNGLPTAHLPWYHRSMRQFALPLLIAGLAALLSGCFDYTEELWLKPDGTAQIRVGMRTAVDPALFERIYDSVSERYACHRVTVGAAEYWEIALPRNAAYGELISEQSFLKAFLLLLFERSAADEITLVPFHDPF